VTALGVDSLLDKGILLRYLNKKTVNMGMKSLKNDALKPILIFP